MYKRNPTHTTWFYWDGDALLGEVQQANDDPQVAPLWVGNVANLMEARNRQKRLAALHARTREYVYYPGTFVPLALIDPDIRLRESANDVAVPARGKSQPSAQTTQQALLTKVVKPAESAQPMQSKPARQTAKTTRGRLGALGGGMQLGVPAGEPEAGQQADAENGLRLGGSGARLGSMPLGSVPHPQQAEDAERITPTAVEQVRAVTTPAETALEARDGKNESDSSGSASHVFHYHVDPNGCPTRITGNTGQVLWLVSYSAWGEVAQQYVDGIESLIRFQGQYADQETGLHYNRNRYYDPCAGQYVGQDPIRLMSGTNLYSYPLNPNRGSDPLGLYEEFAIWPYGDYRHTGDGLSAHELLQSAWLRNNGYGGRSSTNGRGNPSIAIEENPFHRAISSAQRDAGLFDAKKLKTMTAIENIDINSRIMRDVMFNHLLDRGWDPYNARRFTDESVDSWRRQAMDFANNLLPCRS